MRAAELRQSIRSLTRSPWYSAAVIFVLAIGTALASTTFAVVDGVLFRPLPVPQSQQLFVAEDLYALSLRDAREWADALPEARVSTVQRPFDVGVIGDRDAVHIRGASIDARFFDVLGVRPARGGFRSEDFLPAAGRVPALISDELWHRLFGAREDVVGQPLDIAAATNQTRGSIPGFTVAGVLPRAFVYPDSTYTPDLVLPFAATPAQDVSRNWGQARVLIRAPATLSVDAIKARLDARAATQNFPPPETPSWNGVDVRPLSEVLVLFEHRNFTVIFSIALTLVLMTGVNAGGLGLARARHRETERTLRRALGAGRWDLVRLGLMEIAPLAAVGATLGILVTSILVPIVPRLLPDDVLTLGVPRVDWRVFAFSALVSVASIALCTLVVRPGAGRGSATTQRTTTARAGRSISLLVGVQIALAFVLTLGGALLVGSLWKIWQVDRGFPIDHTAFVQMTLPAGVFADRHARMEALLDAVRKIRGVETAAIVDAPFLENSRLHVPNSQGTPWDRDALVSVSGDFFSLMRIAVLDGRLPTSAEIAANDVLVVSAKAARDRWPSSSAVGQSVIFGSRTVTVVGVVSDLSLGALGAPASAQIYEFSPPGAWIQPIILLRGAGAPAPMIDATIERARAIQPGVAITRAMTVEQGLGASIRLRTVRAWLFGTFGVAALIVIATGVIGLVAMTSARRTREIGIRIALGATRGRVVTTLLRDTIIGVAGGLLAGGLASWWAATFVRSYLYQSTVYDASSWTAAAAAIVIVAMLGALLPSSRASRTNPVDALRAD